MLTQLTVTNYAIAEQLDLRFSNGMTALTGETGAGKSIVLDALALTLGGRADAGAVRHGAKRADLTASFDIRNIPAAHKWLADHELDEDGEGILRRVISRDGRSRAFINGRACTLADLRALGEHLMDIHSQHEHQSLLRKETHRRLIDDYAGHGELLSDLRQCWKLWKACREKLDLRLNSREEHEARAQLLNYQVEELDRLAVEDGELESLEQEQSSLANADQLLHHSHLAAQYCAGDEEGAAHLVMQACQQLEQINLDLPVVKEALGMLSEAHIQLTEAGDNLRRFVDDYEMDPQRLQEVEERLSAIYQLARKHRINPDEIPALHQQLRQELDALVGSDSSVESLEQELETLHVRYCKLASKLTAGREKAALELDERICAELTQLGMPSTQFVTRLESLASDAAPAPTGMEDIEFLVSANPGQPARPLAKVASGGELSRISLAIQVVAAQTSTTPSLVFDEVDVGIGGATAEVVGRLLRNLGHRGQIICVTHLPQVAAQAHQHLYVSKFIQDSATYSQIEQLDDTARVTEVARMLGGVDLTDQTLAHAREMFQRGQTLHH